MNPIRMSFDFPMYLFSVSCSMYVNGEVLVFSESCRVHVKLVLFDWLLLKPH